MFQADVLSWCYLVPFVEPGRTDPINKSSAHRQKAHLQVPLRREGYSRLPDVWKVFRALGFRGLGFKEYGKKLKGRVSTRSCVTFSSRAEAGKLQTVTGLVGGGHVPKTGALRPLRKTQFLRSLSHCTKNPKGVKLNERKSFCGSANTGMRGTS